MPSPNQIIETTQIGANQYMWRRGAGLKLETPGAKIEPKDNLLDAQLDEVVAKGLIAQEKLITFCRRLVGHIPGANIANPGIKKRHTIHEKITVRGKSVDQMNDVSRATVSFKHLEDLYAADAWVQAQAEYSEVLDIKHQRGGTIRKNRYTTLTDDGDYKDIKLFLAFRVPPSQEPWLVELQLNLTMALKGKSIGHGIYEITRLGDNTPMTENLRIPATHVAKIADKLRTCYVALKRAAVGKSPINEAVVKDFKTFMDDKFGAVLETMERPGFRANAVVITSGERHLLNQVSREVYTYSYHVAKNATSYKQGGMHKTIKNGEVHKG